MIPKKRTTKGAPNNAVPKGPSPRGALKKSAERLIIADIQDAMDAIWKARRQPARLSKGRKT